MKEMESLILKSRVLIEDATRVHWNYLIDSNIYFKALSTEIEQFRPPSNLISLTSSQIPVLFLLEIWDSEEESMVKCAHYPWL